LSEEPGDVDLSGDEWPTDVGSDGWGIPAERVRELFQTLGKALRAYQLYDENNPVYHRFVNALREALTELWGELDELRLRVTEGALLAEDVEVYRGESRQESLAFLFFKDGVRRVTFRPGIEGEELERFLGVLQRARNARPEGDDLLTILWEADLQFFTYEYVDLLVQGIDLPTPGDVGDFDLGRVLTEEIPGFSPQEDADGEVGSETADPRPQAAAPPPGTVSQDDFNPTLYTLDGAEQQQIAAELERELNRNLRREVLHALLDRAEDGTPARQMEVVEILGTLLPSFLARGAIEPAVELLEALRGVLVSGSVLSPEASVAAEALIHEVSQPGTVRELVRAIVDGTIQPDPKRLGSFLRYLDAGALKPLLQAVQAVEDRQLHAVLMEAIRSIGELNPREVLVLLGSDDPGIVEAACGLSGSMKLVGSAPYLARLAKHPDANIRIAAIHATQALGSAGQAAALIPALEDPEREIRIAAAQALGTLKTRSAAPQLRSAIESREIREADLTEMRAVFEAFGAVADAAEVPMLAKLLSHKRFLRGHEPSELRACAALALGRIGGDAAHAALRQASDDPDPVVRSAASRAIRGEEAR